MHKIYSSLKGFYVYKFFNYLGDMSHLTYIGEVFDNGFDIMNDGYHGDGNGDGDNNNWGHYGSGKGFGFLYGFSSGGGEVSINCNFISLEETNA